MLSQEAASYTRTNGGDKMSLENVKIGDTLCVEGRYSAELLTVTRVTKSMVETTDGSRIQLWNKSGYLRGSRYGDSWNRPYAKVSTPEMVQRIKDSNEKIKIIARVQSKFDQATLRNLSLDKLRKLQSFINELGIC